MCSVASIWHKARLPLLALTLALLTPAGLVLAATDQWATSLHDIARTGSSTDTAIPTSQAGTLVKQWSLSTGGPIASQPAIVNGVAYVGSWDGYEYAINASTGAVIWKTFLGITAGESDCNPQTAGVSSAATVQNGTVYVGGGDAYWYALDAATGAVQWRVYTGDNSVTGGHYNWSSPLVYNGFAYVGVASLGDCPLVQGQLLKVDLSTHQIVATLNVVPNGEVGGGIWTSPAYDTATNRIFTVTGTEQSDAQQYAQAVLAVDPNTMTVVDSWHLPEAQAVADSDWTTSTVLFTDANGRQLVMTTNKNGYSYAFLRSNLAAGPVWRQQVAIGNDCAACGESTVSSAAVGQGQIYQAGGVKTLGGIGYGGSVQAWNPTTGAVVWQHPTTGAVIGAITYDNGMVIDGEGSALEVLDASNGHRLYSYDTGPGNLMFAAPSVSNGIIITGNTAGTVYAFGLPTQTSQPPVDPNCPTGWTCQDIGNATPSGSESVLSGTWNVNAGGSGVGGTADAFRLMTEPTAGDAQVSAKVTAQQNVSSGAQAGLIVRQSNDPGSPYYAVVVTPGGVEVAYRRTFGGATTTLSGMGGVPLYLEIQRQGDTLSAATSADGVTYTFVPGATATVTMPYASLAGLAVASGINGTAGTATLANVTIGTPNNTPQDVAPATACPTGWTCGDIGDPLLVGDQSLSGSTWTMKAAGGGIDGSSDQLHYVWQDVTADTTVTARITGQTNTAAAAKAGLLLRTDLSSNAAYYGAFEEADGKLVVEYRDTKGLPAAKLVSPASSLPQYIQVIRSGTTFSTYTSTDGSNWSPVIGGTITLGNLSGTLLAGLADTSASANAVSTVTADALSVTNNAATTAADACPGGWACSDVGPTIPAGSQYYYNGVWSVLAGGKDIYGPVDEMRLITQNLTGDGSVSAHVTSQVNTDPWAKAGLMLRATADPGSPYFAILVTPGNGTVVQYRTSAGGSTSQVAGVAAASPLYIKVTRAGSTFTAYTSPDGTTWTAYPGGSITLSLPTTVLAGMAATSHSQFVTSTVTLDTVVVTPSNTSLPTPWTDNDVGNPTPAGSASYANGVYTVSGGGNDIWGTPYMNLDQFHYVSQPLPSDGSIVARVTAQGNTSPWAKAGLMIKQSTAGNAPYVLLAVTPGNGVVFQAGFSSSTAGGTFTLPVWLKLTRTGNTVTGYSSTDGTTWTTVGTTTLANSATIGLFSTAHNSGALSTATFDNVTVASPTNGLPSPWTDNDIGNPTPAGSAGYANGVFTVNGGGNDIWKAGNIIDQFNYTWQPLTGTSETITARVTSQTNTSSWAKAGLMIKQSTTAGSPYALLAVTPGNGTAFQYGYNTSVSGGTYTFPNAWLRLRISGTTVTAFVSPDGSTWTTVGTTTLSLTNPATIGLFVCSHNSGALSTATFDNVTVTSP